VLLVKLEDCKFKKKTKLLKYLIAILVVLVNGEEKFFLIK